MPDIEVATFVPPDSPMLFDMPNAIMERSGPGVPWDDRPKVTISANDDDLVQDTIARAMRRFGISARESEREWVEKYPPLRPAFYGGGDNEPVYLNVLLKEDGSATWVFEERWVTHNQVAASANARLFRGEPSRLYLVLDQPLAEGGNGFFFWNEFARTLPQALMYIGGLYGGLRLFIDLGWAAYKVILRLEKNWSSKGAALREIKATVDQPRTTEEAARLLGTSESDAETLLNALGLTQSADGRWRTGPNKDADVLKLAFSVAEEAADHYLSPNAVEQCLDEIAALPEEERLPNVHAIIERAYAEESRWDDTAEEDETDFGSDEDRDDIIKKDVP